MGELPDHVESESALDELLSRPSSGLVSQFKELEGDVLVLGAGGKMGPTLAQMAVRASALAGCPRRVIAVSRFSDAAARESCERSGVETRTCDLLDRTALSRLDEAPNVVFMAGRKFGSSGNESLTWAMNTHVPALIAERYRDSRLVVFSTGNVYGLRSVGSGGAREEDPPQPIGEYSMSCLGRERIFEHFSRAHSTRVATIRLNYAVELRYGVVLDIARRVWNGEPIRLETGHVNLIWQGDANAMCLSAFKLAASPPAIVNVAGNDVVSVRSIALRLSELLGRKAKLEGSEGPNAFLSDDSKARSLLGEQSVSVDQMITWVAAWVRAGGKTFDKPTHFETRDGRY